MLLTHSATLTRVCTFASSSKSLCRSIEQTSASLKCFQKVSQHREAFKSAAKQLTARKSASGLLTTLRASSIVECRRFISASGLGNTDKPAWAGIGSDYSLGQQNMSQGKDGRKPLRKFSRQSTRPNATAISASAPWGPILRFSVGRIALND